MGCDSAWDTACDNRIVARIRESIEISAPAARVWAVVHEDLKNATRWTAQLEKTEILDPLPLRKGSRLRHHIQTPGGLQEIEVEHTSVVKPKSCSGKLVDGPLRGTFRYSYREAGGRTRVSYEMDYQPAGLARLFGGMIERQVPQDLARTLQALKKYVESGKGPKAARAAG